MQRSRERSCPECGKPMEHGFLRAESFIGGAKWTAKRTLLGAGGASIAGTDAGGNVYIEGFRCASCRFLALNY